MEEWTRSASIRKEIELDEFVVMPNHFHAILHIIPTIIVNEEHRTGDRPENRPIVGAYGHTHPTKPT